LDKIERLDSIKMHGTTVEKILTIIGREILLLRPSRRQTSQSV